MTNLPPLITVDELLERWPMGRSTLYDLMRRPRNPLPSVKIGRRRFIDPDAAAEWLAAEQKDTAA